jgi:hypothetical protein
LVRIDKNQLRNPILRKITLALVALLVLSGCAPQHTKDAQQKYLITGKCAGIEVVVNYGLLSEGERKATCVKTETELPAKEALAKAGITTEGTKTYPDLIVCRVNGLPSATERFTVPGEEPHLESCDNMPPAFAYWGLWVKSSDKDEWGYASEGVGTLKVAPGQSLGLVFTTGGLTPVPN